MGYRRKKDDGKENGGRFQRRATMYPFNTSKFLYLINITGKERVRLIAEKLLVADFCISN